MKVEVELGPGWKRHGDLMRQFDLADSKRKCWLWLGIGAGTAWSVSSGVAVGASLGGWANLGVVVGLLSVALPAFFLERFCRKRFQALLAQMKGAIEEMEAIHERGDLHPRITLLDGSDVRISEMNGPERADGCDGEA